MRTTTAINSTAPITESAMRRAFDRGGFPAGVSVMLGSVGGGGGVKISVGVSSLMAVHFVRGESARALYEGHLIGAGGLRTRANPPHRAFERSQQSSVPLEPRCKQFKCATPVNVGLTGRPMAVFIIALSLKMDISGVWE